jgi:hypothetical protein
MLGNYAAEVMSAARGLVDYAAEVMSAAYELGDYAAEEMSAAMMLTRILDKDLLRRFFSGK